MEADIVPLPRKQDWTTRIGVKAFRFKGLIKRYWWILLLTVSVSLAWQAWTLFRTPVLYSSEGTLMVTERVNLGDNNTGAREESDEYYTTQLKYLSARRYVALTYPDLTACDVQITPTLEPRSTWFTVRGVGTNAAYTKFYVQAVMEKAIEFKQKGLRNVTNAAEGSVGSELTRLGKDKDAREAALHDFIEKNNMPNWEQLGNTAAKYLADLKGQQANLQTEIDRLQTLSDQEILTQSGGGAENGISKSDPQGAALSQQYLMASQELAAKKAEFAQRSLVWKPAHPRLMALKDDIDSLQARMNTIEIENRENAKIRIAADKSNLEVLNKSIDSWTKKALDAGEKDSEYQRLKDDLNRTSATYDKLTAAMNSLDSSEKTPDSMSVLKAASDPVLVDPGAVRKLATGLIVGLVLGIAILAIMDKADDRFSSSTEVMEHFSEPIMGQIPNVDESRTKDGLPLLTEDDDRYTFGESLRSLRSSLLFMPNQGQLKSLLVTSSIPGEGKSTIASNLGITMALAGTRVLLVDADLRRGDLASLFNVDGRFGLSSILRDEMPWRSVTKATPFANLTLIPRGPVTNQSSELLLVPHFDTLMREWKSLYDLVLFNTSPILATDDTASIAPNFDGVLMVIRAQFTSARLIRNSLNAMYQRQVNVLGLIINSVDTEMPDYYYYRYPKYYAA
jgi:capsular exopolysaccharide synthesis family protein